MAWPRLGYTLVLYLLVPLIWWRVWREQALTHPRRQRLGFIPHCPQGERVLWLHCASVGEVQAARPLIEALLDRYPDHYLTITTMTATGAERVAALIEACREPGIPDRLRHRFVPLDFPGSTGRFVDRLAPELALFFETELWPNLLHACRKRGVPVLIVNGRLSTGAYHRYRRLRPLMEDALSHVAWLAAKSEVDAERYRALGMDPAHITVVGSLKFDLTSTDVTLAVSEHLRTRLGKRPIWVAGSTHPGEDEQVLDAHARLLDHHPDALLILVPRHPRRFDGVATLCERRGLRLSRRSLGEWPGTQAVVYLGDTMGELSMLYGAADIAFVGGSLVPIGGHNLLEPLSLGVPVITGPALANFEDVAQVLREADALVEVCDAQALALVLVGLFDDEARRRRLAEAGRRVMVANRGALEGTMAAIQRCMAER